METLTKDTEGAGHISRRISSVQLPLDTPDLPATVRQLLTLMPARDVIRLVRSLHGERLYFWQRQKSEVDYVAYAKLVPVIGDKNARMLIREWRGDALEVPNCARAVSKAVARWVRAQFDAGATVPDLCRRTGYSRRWVFYLLKEASAEQQTAPIAHSCEKGDGLRFDGNFDGK